MRIDELRIADCGLRIEGERSGEDHDAPAVTELAEAGSGSGEDQNLTRREMLKRTAAAAVSIPLAAGLASGATADAAAAPGQWKAPLFFTRDELALVEELSEIIIPTDAHSPGARAAGVASYIDARLAESWTEEPKSQWRSGLKAVDSIAQEMHGKPFMQGTPEQRLAVVARLAQNEMNPQKPEEHFFREIKGRTVHAYYSSKIGIHQEIEYKGNVPIKEFAGTDVSQPS